MSEKPLKESVCPHCFHKMEFKQVMGKMRDGQKVECEWLKCSGCAYIEPIGGGPTEEHVVENAQRAECGSSKLDRLRAEARDRCADLERLLRESQEAIKRFLVPRRHDLPDSWSDLLVDKCGIKRNEIGYVLVDEDWIERKLKEIKVVA